MASSPPSRPSTSGRSGKEKEIGPKVLETEKKITPARQQNQGSDISPVMEHKSSMHSTAATQGKSVLKAFIGDPTIWRTIGDLKTSESVEENVNGERIFTDKCSKPPHGKGKMNPSAKAHVSRDVNDALAMSKICGGKDNALVPVNAETYGTNMEVICSARQVPPRSSGSQLQMRNPSYTADVDRTKRLKIVCEFHAKGWCIRGKSCSFLHSDEGLDINKKASSGNYIPPQQSGDDHKFSCQSDLIVLERVDALGKAPLLVGESSLHKLCTDNFSIGGKHNHLEISLGHGPSVSSSLHQRNSMDSGLNISSNDWEPSIPFVPSYDVTKDLLMKEKLLEPLHWSFRQTVDRPVRFTFSGQGLSVKSETQIEGHRSSLKDDGSSKKDGGGANLPGRRAWKEFESALILHVKGLLEPAWLADHVTKDDFKTIVQKSVEKVLNSFHPNHIPRSSEFIQLYISSSQAKLEKLVQDYLKIYRKS